MTSQEMMMAELIGLRCSVAALARQVLLDSGSKSFVHAETQASKFVAVADQKFSAEVAKRAAEVVADLFGMADSV